MCQGGQELLISEVTEKDRGQYICYTTSPSGQRMQRNINLIIKCKWIGNAEKNGNT